jgi:hypothetical protein
MTIACQTYDFCSSLTRYRVSSPVADFSAAILSAAPVLYLNNALQELTFQKLASA